MFFRSISILIFSWVRSFLITSKSIIPWSSSFLTP
jgi:hypothetical protein